MGLTLRSSTIALLLLLFPSFLHPYHVQIANVKAYRVNNHHEQLLPITRLVHIELEQVLDEVSQPIGTTHPSLPKDYLLFRLSSPVITASVPHPIHELVVTLPKSIGEPPRLLIKNKEKEWREYRTNRPLTTIINQLEG